MNVCICFFSVFQFSSKPIILIAKITVETISFFSNQNFHIFHEKVWTTLKKIYLNVKSYENFLGNTCGFNKYTDLIDNNLGHICTGNTRCPPNSFLCGILDKGTKFRVDYSHYSNKEYITTDIKEAIANTALKITKNSNWIKLIQINWKKYYTSVYQKSIKPHSSSDL